MTDRRRNLLIIVLVLAMLAGSVLVILTKPTKLGLDLRGGVELVYQGVPTPKVPKVTPEAIDDALNTIRKRTDSLGVSEPEIQRAGADQIQIGLPDVANADKAIEQVGTTAQLQFYDWEPNVFTTSGPVATLAELESDTTSQDNPQSKITPQLLYDAVKRSEQIKPRAEQDDLPAGSTSTDLEAADKANDTTGTKYYLFNPSHQLIEGPDADCANLLSDYEDEVQDSPTDRKVPAGSACADQLKAIPPSSALPDNSEILTVPQGIILIQQELQTGQRAPKPGAERYYILEDDSELSGADITNPKVQTDSRTQEPVVAMDFTEKGRDAFSTVTKRIAQRGSDLAVLRTPPGATPAEQEQIDQNSSQSFAITLDNQIVSLASIDFNELPEGIDGRTGAQINNIGSLDATNQLAENLRIGALPITLKLISQTQVSATLGAQALSQGLIAAGAGLALTLLFLLLFYRVLGVVAGMALVTYAVFLFALVKLIPITLTLPGIAGLILTLGVAADANIVIFERIKEEARDGRSIPAAITNGYGKALRTIIDANVVTIGVAFILFTLATAGVKGFAFTLGIGTIVSLFTAVLATSAILGSISRTRILRSSWALGAGSKKGHRRFDFTGASRYFFSASGLIIAAGAIAISTLGINFGIDFASGTRIKTPLEKPATAEQIRQALPAQFRDAKIQLVQEPELGSNVVQIAVKELQPDEQAQVRTALDSAFGVSQADYSTSSIGPTFGQQIATTAIIAIIASLFLISIYIGLRFEFKYAVPVLIALAHDILITGGVYALTGRELTASTVAALLTILGYSLYDTIIVFDRIRENVPRMPRATFSQIVNRSMSEVITRSLVTSLCTLFPIAGLMIFGGETLRDFGFALLVGVASGTYSSIFIAAPVLTEWKERESLYRRRRQIVMEDHDGHVPAYFEVSLGESDRHAAPQGPGKTTRRQRKAATATATGAGRQRLGRAGRETPEATEDES
ncbi:MAG: SecD/SecF fusion protein [Thermoleophilaceae bacterium]|jgi:SecD/SecF fusion protein|nr:SecD/SecF fusion protein [Thermoleophilaceae bacterium]